MFNLRKLISLKFKFFFIVIISLQIHNNIHQSRVSASINSDGDNTQRDINKLDRKNYDPSNEDLQEEERYEKWLNEIKSYIVPGLGDLGRPAYLFALDDNMFLSAMASMYDKGINVIVSNNISWERALPDVRNEECRKISYDNEKLPSASVIIVFHNEPWSVLVRTVHSVLRESTEKYLKEIILIDDKSSEEELHGPLSYYVRTRFPSKVKIVRLPQREGTVKARLEGAKVATGDVLVFLDPHSEVIREWLEPMLLRVKEKRNVIVTPLIDTISDISLGYDAKEKTIIGGFTWSGHHIWVDVPNRTVRAQKSPIDPIPSPTMLGGTYAIDKQYFWEFGSYDEVMDGWGGENLEMSFRAWQCGGSIEVLPCSRVGHIFRNFMPYKIPVDKAVEIFNVARAVNVWMDEYSRLFYYHNPKVEIGDIKERVELRKKLDCKSFKWYMENIYPEKFIPDEDVRAYGRVRLYSTDICLDISRDFEELDSYNLQLGECKKELTYNQFFSLTNTNLLRTELRCASILVNDTKIEMNNCDTLPKEKEWKFKEDGSLVHVRSQLCLDATGLKPNDEIVVKPCDGSPGQIWDFDYYPDKSLERRP